MRRVTLLLALTLLTTVLVSGTAAAQAAPRVAGLRAAVVAPQLQQQLDAAGQDEMVEAIVVLKSQADLTSVSRLARKNRPGAAARILRARADLTQRRLLALLELRQAQGLVSDIEPLWIVNAIAVTATPAVISELAAHQDVREIRPDLVVPAPQTAATATAPAETNVALVNAPALWDLGYRGQGIVVANMDTGVDVTHPDLASRWRGGTNSWYDPNGEHPATPTDVSGHGTWTMGVMVGGDAGGSSVGVAPDATWIAVKIFNDHGTATATGIHQGSSGCSTPTATRPPRTHPTSSTTHGRCRPPAACLTSSPTWHPAAAGIPPVFAAETTARCRGAPAARRTIRKPSPSAQPMTPTSSTPTAVAAPPPVASRSTRNWPRQASASTPRTCTASTPIPPARRSPPRTSPARWRCCCRPSPACRRTGRRPRWKTARSTSGQPARTIATGVAASTRSPPTSGWPPHRTLRRASLRLRPTGSKRRRLVHRLGRR